MPLAQKFGIQVDVCPAWRAAVTGAMAYAAVGAAVYVALRRLTRFFDGGHDDDDMDPVDENYLACIAALSMFVAAWWWPA